MNRASGPPRIRTDMGALSKYKLALRNSRTSSNCSRDVQQDVSLREASKNYPESTRDMTNISGFVSLQSKTETPPAPPTAKAVQENGSTGQGAEVEPEAPKVPVVPSKAGRKKKTEKREIYFLQPMRFHRVRGYNQRAICSSWRGIS